MCTLLAPDDLFNNILARCVIYIFTLLYIYIRSLQYNIVSQVFLHIIMERSPLRETSFLCKAHLSNLKEAWHHGMTELIHFIRIVRISLPPVARHHSSPTHGYQRFVVHDEVVDTIM